MWVSLCSTPYCLTPQIDLGHILGLGQILGLGHNLGLGHILGLGQILGLGHNLGLGHILGLGQILGLGHNLGLGHILGLVQILGLGQILDLGQILVLSGLQLVVPSQAEQLLHRGDLRRHKQTTTQLQSGLVDSASALLSLQRLCVVCGYCLVTLSLTKMSLIAAHLNARVILVVTV